MLETKEQYITMVEQESTMKIVAQNVVRLFIRQQAYTLSSSINLPHSRGET